MEEMITIREAKEILGLTHLEVNRRIHRGQIPAKKVGWMWVLERKEVEGVKKKEWYKKLMARRAAVS